MPAPGDVQITLYPTVCHLEGDEIAIVHLASHLQVPDDRAVTGLRSLVTPKGYFPPGLASRAEWYLATKGYRVQVNNQIQEPPGVRVEPTTLPLRHYQATARETMLQWPRTILGACPRSGKTYVAASLIESLPDHRPAVVVVESTDLLLQTVRELTELLPQETVGRIPGGLGVGEEGTVIVAMAQTVASRLPDPSFREWWESVRLAIGDEGHHFASPRGQQVFGALKGAWRVYGLTGTPYRNDGQDLLLEGVLGPVCYRIPYSRMVQEINPATGRGYLVPGVFIFQRMPPVPAPRRDPDWRDVYDPAVVYNDTRNRAILDFSRYMVGLGISTVILVERIPHGEALAETLGWPFTHGKSGESYRKDMLEGLRSGEIPGAVSTLYREAIDIPRLGAVVNAGGMKSSIGFYQQMRHLTDFPGKRVAIQLDFWDNAPYLSQWSRTRMAYLREEEAFTEVRMGSYLSGDPVDPAKAYWWIPQLLQEGLPPGVDLQAMVAPALIRKG